MKDLEMLDERLAMSDMTGFKLVTGKTPRETLLRHFELDLRILNSADIKVCRVRRVVIRDDGIDIRSIDNATPVSYVFFRDAKFTPQSIRHEINEICNRFEVFVEN